MNSTWDMRSDDSNKDMRLFGIFHFHSNIPTSFYKESNLKECVPNLASCQKWTIVTVICPVNTRNAINENHDIKLNHQCMSRIICLIEHKCQSKQAYIPDHDFVYRIQNIEGRYVV